MFVGWDWGNGAHDVAVMDDDGRLVDKWKVAHTAEGLAALASHSYAHLFAELPRIGVANFGQVIAEVGPLLERGAKLSSWPARWAWRR